MNQAFDLTALQAALKRYPEYKDLSKQIGRFAAARSFEIDLEAAKSAMTLLQGLDPDDGRSRMMWGRPLMTQAIMMYCRAAIEDGGGRYKIGVIKNFTAEQVKKHQSVVKLRNQNIGHFGIGEGEYGEAWVKEKIVLKVVSGRASINNVYRRANYIASLLHDLSDLCETALARVREAATLWQGELLDVITKLAGSDPAFRKLMASFPFDPSEFFSAPEPAGTFWADGEHVHEIFTPKSVTSEASIAIGPTVATRI